MAEKTPTGSDGTKDEVRIVLLGKTGAGKSKTGNTILQEEFFKSDIGFSSETKSCCHGYKEYNHKTYMVVDTPGIFDTREDMHTNCADLVKCLAYVAPGPHVFLITIEIGRYTEEDKGVINIFHEMFGEGMMNHSIIMFTFADKLKIENTGRKLEERERKLEELLKEAPSSLLKLIESCHGRTFPINNIAGSEERNDQANQLIAKITEWGLDKNVFIDKGGVLPEIETILNKEERDTGVSRDNIREAIMRGLIKAKRVLQQIIPVLSSFSEVLMGSNNPTAQLVGELLRASGPATSAILNALIPDTE